MLRKSHVSHSVLHCAYKAGLSYELRMCGRRSELSSLSCVSHATASHGALCNIAKALEHCVSSACRVCTPPRASGRARCPATRRWTLPKRGVGNAQSRVRSQASDACGVACTSVHSMLSALIRCLLCHESPCSGICSHLWPQSGSRRFACCSQLGTNTNLRVIYWHVLGATSVF